MVKLRGSINISGDKSISHRALILSSLCTGKSKIYNLLESEDVLSTVAALKKLGIQINRTEKYWEVIGNGTGGFIEPNEVIDCGNSGTTARLLIGTISSNPIKCTIVGDRSLSRRSMSRVTNLLSTIGADFKLTKDDYLPLMISGNSNLLPSEHVMQKASAQIKSAIILSSLNIDGKTKIVEKIPTRNHTEKMMKFLKIKFKEKKLKNGGKIIELNGPYEIVSKNIHVANDPSSAAFFIAGALIIPNSKITINNVAINPSRIQYLRILKKMGAKIKIKKTKIKCGEEIGNITAEYSKMKGTKISSSFSPFLIDEYPILAIVATQAKGKTVMKGLGELRHKESDRINSIVSNLKKIGYEAYSKKDDIHIKGKNLNFNKMKKIKTFGDHRIAMSFNILNILLNNKIIIDNQNCILTSYPQFHKHLKKLLK